MTLLDSEISNVVQLTLSYLHFLDQLGNYSSTFLLG
jgi:hypothetical protein